MRPWLFRILRNEFYQHARRAWRSTELEPEQAERTLVANESLEARSDFRVLQAAIDFFPKPSAMRLSWLWRPALPMTKPA